MNKRDFPSAPSDRGSRSAGAEEYSFSPRPPGAICPGGAGGWKPGLPRPGPPPPGPAASPDRTERRRIPAPLSGWAAGGDASPRWERGLPDGQRVGISGAAADVGCGVPSPPPPGPFPRPIGGTGPVPGVAEAQRPAGARGRKPTAPRAPGGTGRRRRDGEGKRKRAHFTGALRPARGSSVEEGARGSRGCCEHVPRESEAGAKMDTVPERERAVMHVAIRPGRDRLSRRRSRERQWVSAQARPRGSAPAGARARMSARLCTWPPERRPPPGVPGRRPPGGRLLSAEARRMPRAVPRGDASPPGPAEGAPGPRSPREAGAAGSPAGNGAGGSEPTVPRPGREAADDGGGVGGLGRFTERRPGRPSRAERRAELRTPPGA
ncbi:translation initiation factor IF-2-like [Ornithorhynchus anatinus]|uniref:translation initiation factor IF-2-like n=1 Tax=Ornithorhynchus anatinus TaxID=9258 RepID=UPI0010A8AA50|nr:translation initiation factor IF-2-like [Ornithorhynchus anatinus]